MSTLLQVILFSLIGGVISLAGGMLLLSSKKRAKLLAKYATPFAAGALLAAAFMDLLREAAHEGDVEIALGFALVGILAFFLLERFLHWFHHHHEHEHPSTDPTVSLVIIGDTIHNFIDGIAIAAGFLVNPPTGMVVTLAVAAHEIPQEIGDFGLLLHKGMERRKVILVNVLSALATTVAAVVFFQLGQSVEISFDAMLGLVAGFFIYIAVSDIIPSIHKQEKKALASWQSAMLILGAVIVSVATINLHGYIDQAQDHDESSHHETDHTCIETSSGAETCADDYIGLSEAEAYDKAHNHNLAPKTLSRDGDENVTNTDLGGQPIYFVIEEDLVSEVEFETNKK